MSKVLPLARVGLEPQSELRPEPGLLGRLLQEETTSAIIVAGRGRILTTLVQQADTAETPASRLAWVQGEQLRELAAQTALVGPGEVLFLGRGPVGAVLAVLVGATTARGEELPPPLAGLPAGEWQRVPAIAADLDDLEVDAATTASALVAWHATHRHCPGCGQPLEIRAGGWELACPTCGETHFPRIDPAIIVAVTDEDDRVLLAHNRAWRTNYVSLVAGFVDAGEAFEQAVVREVREETGVSLTRAAVEFRYSQPWPFPRSLMISCRARAYGRPEVIPDGVEIDWARFYSRTELVAAVAEGLELPGPVTNSYALLVEWFGADLPRPPR